MPPVFQINLHSWQCWWKLKDQAGSSLAVLQPSPWLVPRSLLSLLSMLSLLFFLFLLFTIWITISHQVGSEILARFSRRSTPLPPSNASTTIINTIPFSTLNVSIALTIVVNIVLNMFGISFGSGVQISLILAALLATNKKARKHLRARLQRNMDSFSIGRSCKVEPATISVALVPVRHFRGIQ